ncbi:hypothetical protein BK816_07510 [Boudabousia tangfeifanii]|uniref:PDZ domain-containing protein n=1 Tax=Boudabousia tangfeifanii TaxID=1912795 RepID=A0A1D9MLP3_9ACTO|nr:trypsin-like peptidase domain-containing protein [Boudabousia tangfeifanii]AOZ73158.1 hypothetical protein BK816_07510 [Boudabousia tangfeifanii]
MNEELNQNGGYRPNESSADTNPYAPPAQGQNQTGNTEQNHSAQAGYQPTQPLNEAGETRFGGNEGSAPMGSGENRNYAPASQNNGYGTRPTSGQGNNDSANNQTVNLNQGQMPTQNQYQANGNYQQNNSNPYAPQNSNPYAPNYGATQGGYRAGAQNGYGNGGTQGAYTSSYAALNVPAREAKKPKVKRPARPVTWRSLTGAMLAAVLLSSGMTVGGLYAGGYLGGNTTFISEGNYSDKTAEVAPVVESQAATADWKAVNQAVGNSVVLIAVKGRGGADTGSGVIIDKDAHILTNYHVVAAAQNGGQMMVTLADSRMYEATVVGVDQSTDLAVIKLVNPPKDLTIARLGNSDNLQVGQQVAAIGAPLGLKSTMTTGIISALDRPTVVQDQNIFDNGGVVTNAIQVDASVNPGNSGGPLFDAQGRVIGINSSIMSLSSGQSQAGSIGLGFAIPVDLARKVAQEIIKSGQVQHALLGIQVAPSGAEVNGTLRTGAVVRKVTRESKFGAAGLRSGDVILSIDGKPVVDNASLVGYARRYSPGDEVTLQVARNGKVLAIKAAMIADNN